MAQELIAEADEYVDRSLQRLLQADSQAALYLSPDALDRLRAWMRTDYLFPQLSQWQKGLLVTLYWQSRMLTRLVQVPQGELPARMRDHAEKLTRGAEQVFMELVRNTLKAVDFESLSPAQQIAFEQDFAQVHFDETAR